MVTSKYLSTAADSFSASWNNYTAAARCTWRLGKLSDEPRSWKKKAATANAPATHKLRWIDNTASPIHVQGW